MSIADGPSGHRSDAVGRLGRLVRKELSEILRDRRTILTLVLMPLLLYPLLSIAFQQFLMASRLAGGEASLYHLGFASTQEKDLLVGELFHGQHVLQQEKEPSPGKDKRLLLQLDEPLIEPEVERAVLVGRIDLGVRIADAGKAAPGQPRSCRLIYLQGSARSREAADYVERLLAAAQRGYLEERLAADGAQPGIVLLRPSLNPLQDPTQQELFPLRPLVPLILILMTITGAVYPAIDVTAGERERGTLEILVAAPVPRLGLLFAKYVTVLTVAVLTALVNLGTMFVTVALSGLGPQVFPEGGLTPALVLQLLGLLLLFAAFFSAVLLTLTSFARSFKEAQAYLIPLMLASLGPGLVGLFPGLRLEGTWTVVPLVNIVLLARDLLNGQAGLTAALLVVCSTLLYAVTAIAAAARIFGSEGVLYNEQSTWSDLWRRPAEPQRHATVPGALLCLALMFPAHYVLQGILARTLVSDPSQPVPAVALVLLMALVSVLLFGVFPLVAALLRRVQLAPGFLLRPAPWPAYLAGLLLGLSLWPFVLHLLALLHDPNLDPERYERVVGRMRELRQELPLWLLAGALIVQGIFEELFFRGYLFSALRAASGPATTIAASAMLFGLFHLVVTDAFALDRLLPSTLLGLVLGWVCWQSGSVLPGMLLHACHNSVLVVFDAYRQDGLPGPAFLIIAAVGAGAGIGLLGWGRQGQPAHASR
jgi:ABC-2 type transport system permease protein/sodium transport system permease protein